MRPGFQTSRDLFAASRPLAPKAFGAALQLGFAENIATQDFVRSSLLTFVE